MNKKWAVLLVGIFFIGKAEAKLGQTLDEIKKGLNNKELIPVEEKTYPKDIIMYRAENVRAETGGFDFVRYSFFKDQEKRGNKCIRVNYHKIYERMDEVPLLKNTESTISKNFGQDISSWEKIKSDGFHEDKNVPEAYLGWYGPCEERAFATISDYSEDKKVSLTIVCNSPEYSEFETKVNYKAKTYLSKLLHIPSDKKNLNSLSGVWKSSDGGTYYIQTDGDNIYWVGESGDGGVAWTNLFVGEIDKNSIKGKWLDFPKGRNRLKGNLALQIASDYKSLSYVDGTGGFGGRSWTKVNLQSSTNPQQKP